MFIKYRIMKILNRVEYPKTTSLKTILSSIKASDEKILVCLDVLGTKGYIVGLHTLKFGFKHLSSYARYKHDIKVAFAEWFIKVTSFIILIATLFLTADTERFHIIWQWLSDVLSR